MEQHKSKLSVLVFTITHTNKNGIYEIFSPH